jgi:hypothetical protein
MRWDLPTSNTGGTDSVMMNVHRERHGYHRCIPVMAPLIIPPHQGPKLGSTLVLTSAVPLLEASNKLDGCSIASNWTHAHSARVQWNDAKVNSNAFAQSGELTIPQGNKFSYFRRDCCDKLQPCHKHVPDADKSWKGKQCHIALDCTDPNDLMPSSNTDGHSQHENNAITLLDTNCLWLKLLQWKIDTSNHTGFCSTGVIRLNTYGCKS